jgi:Beta-carotene 15,15'-dioxygenase
MARLIYLDKGYFFWFCRLSFAPLILQHLAVLAYLAFSGFRNQNNAGASKFPVKQTAGTPSAWMKEFARSLLYIALYTSTGPLVGFAIFFGFFHSLFSIFNDIKFFKVHPNPWFNSTTSLLADIIMFYKIALPYTILGIITMLISYKMSTTSLQIDANETWAVFVMGISVLTSAHLWIVAALHNSINYDPFRLESYVQKFGPKVLRSIPAQSLEKNN